MRRTSPVRRTLRCGELRMNTNLQPDRALGQSLTRGLTFRSVVVQVEKRFGAEALASVYALMPREAGDALRYGTVVPTGWYPVAWLRELLAAVRRHAGGGRDLMRALGREGRVDDFKRGVFRLVAFLSSPETLIAQSVAYFCRYDNGGELRVLESRARMARVKFSSCHGWDENVWEYTIGGVTGLLEASGASEVRVRVVEGGGDEPFLVVEARWV